MKFENLPDDLGNAVRETIWEHWTKLGVPGNIRFDESLNLDPEALLLHSANLFKSDLRLCFEVARWLIRYEDLFYPKRLKRIIDRIRDEGGDPLLPEKIRILGFIVETIANHGATASRWQSALSKLEEEAGSFEEKIVLGSDPDPRERYDWGERWGIVAPRILNDTVPYENLEEWNREKWVRSNPRLWVRGFFGVSPRSEVVNFLGCGQPTSGNNLAREVFLSQSSVNVKLGELTEIGVLSSEKVGAANIHALENRRFLPDSFSEKTFFNWEYFYRAVYFALGFFEKASRASSDYQRDKLSLKTRNRYRETLLGSRYNRENVQSLRGVAASIHEIFDSEPSLKEYFAGAFEAS